MSERFSHKAVQHGINGAYVGGDWVPIEECATKFNIKNGSNTKSCEDCSTYEVCPRSRTKHIAAGPDGIYDVIIIGAGCIGGAIARELSKTTNSILILEAADDVTQGATKGNSGIVHAGYDDEPGSVRSKFCWKGNQMFAQLDKELHFGYQMNGSLVVARNDHEMEHLNELLQRGLTNGVENLRILQKDELFQLEPNLQSDCVGALYSPDAGNLIPYEYAIALVENAVDNGVELRIRREVTSITLLPPQQTNKQQQKQEEKQQNKNQKGSSLQYETNEGGKEKKQEGHQPIGRVEESDLELFEVEVNHWEPQNYIQATNMSTPSSSSENVTDSSVASASSSFESLTTSSPSSSPSLTNVLLFLAVIAGVVACLLGPLPDLLATQLSQPRSTVLPALILCSVVVCWGAKLILLPSKPLPTKPSKEEEDHSALDPHQKKRMEYYTMSVPPSVGSGGNSVSVTDMRVGGSGSSSAHQGVVVETEKYRARYVINCAGMGADKVANMLGDFSFKIKPRIGDYLILNRNQGDLVRSTIFPCPGPLGKGVLVQTSLWGTLILGPTARDTHLPEAMSQSPEEIQSFILAKCKELVPTFDAKEVIVGFSGARAKSSTGDWIIRPSESHPRFLLAAGIDSPGLAGSPAIAKEVVRLLSEAGLSLSPNPSFNPLRAPIIQPKQGWKGIKAGPSGKYTNPKENVVCRCEKVTEEEVLRAIHRSLPVDSTQAIRKRTRAGMGHCQGNGSEECGGYDCESRVAALIARETGLPIEAVGRRPWPATSSLPQRWMSEGQKNRLKELQDGASPINPSTN